MMGHGNCISGFNNVSLGIYVYVNQIWDRKIISDGLHPPNTNIAMEQQPSEDVSPITNHDSLHPRHAISCCATLLESPAPDLVPISMCTVKTVLKSLGLGHLGSTPYENHG